jgi:hypothetical protein
MTPEEMQAVFERQHALREGLVAAEQRLSPKPSPVASAVTFVAKSSMSKALVEQLFGAALPRIRDSLRESRSRVPNGNRNQAESTREVQPPILQQQPPKSPRSEGSSSGFIGFIE